MYNQTCSNNFTYGISKFHHQNQMTVIHAQHICPYSAFFNEYNGSLIEVVKQKKNRYNIGFVNFPLQIQRIFFTLPESKLPPWYYKKGE